MPRQIICTKFMGSFVKYVQNFMQNFANHIGPFFIRLKVEKSGKMYRVAVLALCCIATIVQGKKVCMCFATFLFILLVFLVGGPASRFCQWGSAH